MIANQPLVSVIITTYNRKRLLRRSVSSVLSQTYEKFECIIVDDHSTDGTVQLLHELSNCDDRVSVIRHPENRHLSAARNTGIAASKGEYIAFLDDDDTWLPQKLAKQIKSINAVSADVGLVYCWFDIYRGDELVGTRRPQLRGHIFDKILVSQPLGNGSTMLVRRRVIDEVGSFDENLQRGIDGDFLRRVGKRYEIDVVPEVLVHYFIDHEGYPRITGNHRESIIQDIYSQELKLQKFSDEFQIRPKNHAALLLLLCKRYAQIGDFVNAQKKLINSFKINPFSFKVYLTSMYVLKEYVMHVFGR